MKGYLAADPDTTSTENFDQKLTRTSGYIGDSEGSGWTGLTSIYNVADSTVASGAYNDTDWKMITSDAQTWQTTPTSGYYAAPQKAGRNISSAYENEKTTNSYTHVYEADYWDEKTSRYGYKTTTTNNSYSYAANNVSHYYLTCGPNTGSKFSIVENWNSNYQEIVMYNTPVGNGGNDYYYIYHYEPDDINTTEYATSLKRADVVNANAESKTTTVQDCAVLRRTQLSDLTEGTQLKSFYAEFDPDSTYANAFAIDGVDQYNANNATILYNADTDYTVNQNKICSFKTYLVMDEDASVPTHNFGYTVVSAKGTDDNKVFTGIDNLTSTGYIREQYGDYAAYSSFSASANKTYTGVNTNASDPTQDITEADLSSIKTASKLDSLTGKKIAVSTATIDFSQVKFHEPGIYRFAVYQKKWDYSYIKYDDVTDESTKKPLYLDVYVQANDQNDDLAIVNYIFHTDTTDIKWTDGSTTESQTKRPYFVDQYLTTSLKVTKNVSGNQSRLDQYFDFTIQFSREAENAKIKAEFSDKATTSSGGLNYSMSQNGISTVKSYDTYTNKEKFSLKANESVTFKGIPLGASYNLTENSDTLKTTGYTASLKSITGDKYNGSEEDKDSLVKMDANIVSDYYLAKMTEITINNMKNGLVPTGVIVTVAPYAVVGLCGFAGLIFFAKHKKHDDDEEDN